MKRALLLAAALWVSAAQAAEPMPRHLTGVWGTAESLYAGTTGQSELYLLEDGSGALAGSSPPAMFTAGPDKGKTNPNMRVVLGFAFRATIDGDVLVLQPVVKPTDRGAPEQVRLTYRNDAGEAVLAGLEKGTSGQVMKRRSEAVPEQIVEMIKGYLAEAAYAGKAGALRPAPTPRP